MHGGRTRTPTNTESGIGRSARQSLNVSRSAEFSGSSAQYDHAVRLFAANLDGDLLGVLDMNVGLGMVILAPGFLFEFVVVPLWLIVKGFKTPSSVTEFKAPALATAS